jgi:hypothetical protein
MTGHATMVKMSRSVAQVIPNISSPSPTSPEMSPDASRQNQRRSTIGPRHFCPSPPAPLDEGEWEVG